MSTDSGEVVWLISKKWHAYHRHAVKQGLIQTVSAAMSHKCSRP